MSGNGEEDQRQDVLVAMTLITAVTVGVLRMWLPTLSFAWADGTASLPTMLTAAVAVIAVSAPVLLYARNRAASTLSAAVVVLAVVRMVVHLPLGGPARLTITSVGMIAGIVAMGLLARPAGRGGIGLLGLHLGVVLEAVGHLALGTFDLAWRTDPLALLVSAAVVLAAVAATRRCDVEPAQSDAVDTPQDSTTMMLSAWPWLVTGPVLLLVGVLAGVPARAAIAMGLTDGVAAAWLAAALLLGAAAAITARTLGPARLGVAGAVLVLVGTAGALLPDGRNAVLAQLLLGLGLGAVVGAAAAVPDRSTPTARAMAVVGSWLLLTVGVVLYYGIHTVTLRLPARSVLLLTAAGVATIGALAGRQVRRAGRAAGADNHAGTGDRASPRTLAGLLIGVVLLTLLTGVAAHRGPPPPQRADAGVGVRVALVNLRSGYDLDGRFAIERTAALLAAEDPDIVVLNEVDRGWLMHGGHDVLRLLSHELGLPAVFAPAADEVWGNAVLSRFPVTEVSVERLPRGVAPMARSQVTVVLDLDGTNRLAVIGTHLSRVGGPDDGTRIAQARAVAASVARHRERGQPVVVAGTFNAGPDTAEIETFGSLVSSALPRGMLTSPADDPDALLVQVLLSPDLRRRSSEAADVVISEHRPVFVTVELR